MTVSVPNADISKYLTKEDVKYIEDSESKLGKVRSARASEERKVQRLMRKLQASPEYQEMVRSQQRIKDFKKLDNELATKVSGIYEKALQDVDGESLADKYQTLSEKRK